MNKKRKNRIGSCNSEKYVICLKDLDPHGNLGDLY